MRKIVTVLLLLSMLLGLAACSGATDPQQSESYGSSQSKDPTRDTEAEPNKFTAQSEPLSLPLRTCTDPVVSTDAQVDQPQLLSRTEDADSGVTALYFQTPRMAYFGYGNGIFTICTDAVEMNQGNHYQAYVFDGEAVTALDNHNFSREYSLYGQTYRVEFGYAVWDDRIILTYSPAEYYEPTDIASFMVSLDSNHCLIPLYEPAGSSFLLHLKVLELETGELTDYLPDIPVETLSFHSYGIRSITFDRENERTFLLQMANGECSYINADNSVVLDLSALTGVKIISAVFAGRDIVCCDNQKEIWKISTADSTACRLLSDKNLLHYIGSSFALYADGDTIHVYDCISETDTAIVNPEGWDLTKLDFTPSNDGRKVVAQARPDDTIVKILSFDCDSMIFTEITIPVPQDHTGFVMYYTEDDDLYITKDMNRTTIYKIG